MKKKWKKMKKMAIFVVLLLHVALYLVNHRILNWVRVFVFQRFFPVTIDDEREALKVLKIVCI